MGRDRTKKNSVAVTGPWIPVSLKFLRSRACAELSPHAAKLLLDLFAMLGPNATRNGDLSVAPRIMLARGWTSRATLREAVRELIEHGLLFQTKQGSRLDCSLFAITLYPLDCDVRKLDIGPGGYSVSDWIECGETPPCEVSPATWRRARKIKPLAPPRNKTSKERSISDQSHLANSDKTSTLYHHGTNSLLFKPSTVPPRVTYLDKPSVGIGLTHQTR